MSPIAAYYIFTANENEHAAARVHGIDDRPRRLSLRERFRSLVGALRPRLIGARPA